MACGIRCGSVLHPLMGVTLLGTRSYLELETGEGVAPRHALIVQEADRAGGPARWRLVDLGCGTRLAGQAVTTALLTDGDAITVGAATVVYTSNIFETRRMGGVLFESEIELIRSQLGSHLGLSELRRGAALLRTRGAAGWAVLHGDLDPAAGAAWLDRHAARPGAFEIPASELAAVPASWPRFDRGFCVETGPGDHLLIVCEWPAASNTSEYNTPFEQFAANLPGDLERERRHLEYRVPEVQGYGRKARAEGWLVLDDAYRECRRLATATSYWLGLVDGRLVLDEQPGAHSDVLIHLDGERYLWSAPLSAGPAAPAFASSRGGSSRGADTDHLIQGFYTGTIQVGGRTAWYSLRDPTTTREIADVVDGGWLLSIGAVPPEALVKQERSRFGTLSTEESVLACLVAAVRSTTDLREAGLWWLPADARRNLDPRAPAGQAVATIAGRGAYPPVASIIGGVTIGEVLAARKSYFSMGVIHDAGRAAATMYMQALFGVFIGARDDRILVLTGSPMPGGASDDFPAAAYPFLAILRAAGLRLEEIWSGR